jgi:galactokinase
MRDPGALARASAPGRVNLIGEHTDYNRGWVLPLALDRSLSVVLTDDPPTANEYVLGVFSVLGIAPRGVEISGDLPAGEGLGSSAALCVAVARAAAPSLSPRDVAEVAWRAETEFVGVPCGRMDQLASALGTPGEALLIDCRSYEVTPVPIPAGARFTVHSSGVRHANATSGYAERRRECDEAAEALGVESLREVDPRDPRLMTAATLVARAGNTGLHPRLAVRARHVAGENARVLEFAERLAAGDLERCGALMDASHASQRDLFQVSVPEVDRLVERLRADGALGARLTGGGFGGSVVALWH